MASASKRIKHGDMSQWDSWWDGDFTPWQMDEVHPDLARHLDVMTGGRGNKRTFFIPLCGKTRDMKHLYDLGHMVIGTEGTEKACREFFAQSGMEFDFTDNLKGDSSLRVFASKDSRIRLICGNHFDVSRDKIDAKIDCVWDRGSLVAISPSDRDRYAELMKSLLDGHSFTYLLSSVVYEVPDGVVPSDEAPGPPFSTDLNEVKQLFQDVCNFRVLDVGRERNIPTTFHMSADGNVDKSKPLFKGRDMLLMMTSKGEGSDQDRIDYWQGRYVEGSSKWHTGSVYWSLEKFYDRLVQDMPDKSKILVPLCGKAADLIWLYEKGHEVVGIEGVHYVAESVFRDNGIKCTTEFLPSVKGNLIRSEDGRLKIYVCDFFDVTADVLGGTFPLVFDRGAFGAVDKADRENYSRVIASLLNPEGKTRIKMTVNFYDDTQGFSGPPMSVPREQVKELFQINGAKFEVLEEQERPDGGKRFGLKTPMYSTVYLISRE